MKTVLRSCFSLFILLLVSTHGNGYPKHSFAPPAVNKLSGVPSTVFIVKPNRLPANPASNGRHAPLTRYEQTCAARFFDFCHYLLTPPDIIIDSKSYIAGQKQDEVVMQRERAEDTARIKTAVLRYTVVPEPANREDSLHFSQEELSDQEYRKLEAAFASIEKLLDTCYNAGGQPLSLVPLRLHDDASIRARLEASRLPGTFLLCRGNQTLAIVLFTPRDRMKPAELPRISGWSVDFRNGPMVFHDIAARN